MKPARRAGWARSYIPYSSCMHAAPSTSIPSVNTSPPSITRNSATAMAGTAASTRAPRSEPDASRLRRRRRRRPRPARWASRASAARRADARSRAGSLAPAGVCGPICEWSLAISRPSSPTEPAAALGVLRQRLLERLATEVGPQLLAEHQLGVSRLPQQVVGQPPLAAGTDDQVGVVHLGRVQACAKLLFARAREAAGSVEDLGTSTVVEGHEQ